MKCPNCKENGLIAKVQVTLTMLAEDTNAVNKRTIIKHSTQIESVNRGGIVLYCPHCFWRE